MKHYELCLISTVLTQHVYCGMVTVDGEDYLYRKLRFFYRNSNSVRIRYEYILGFIERLTTLA